TAAETAAIERELHLERGLFPALVILAGAGVVVAARRSRAASRLEPGPAALTGAALAAFVCAYAAIHLVIEAQPRYRYAVMPAILALAAPAWRAILTHRRERRATVAAPTG
ncbi:MAG: hypothetical protein LBR19_04625, partial [Bifidobacteriaceae bacterium]|nr:hypothetical protein [Bifidobacteriaceae bacterium]